MGIHLQRLTRADYVVSQWSGGSTTQLAIAPKGAVYANRDFLWRLSSATVELDESDFTPLPDYERLIAPLRGEMVLIHDGGAPIDLSLYQVHAFDGGAGTRSVGRCVDFNLMLRKGAYRGNVYPVEFSEAGVRAVPVTLNVEEFLLYCVEGHGTLSAAGEAVELHYGETVRLRNPENDALTLTCPAPAAFMAAEIEPIPNNN